MSELYVIQKHKRQGGITFGFILYTMLLLVTLVAYFRMGLGDLAGVKPLEGSKVYYCQYQK